MPSLSDKNNGIMYNKRISERSGNNMMEVQQYMLDKIRDFKVKVCNPEAHLNNIASCDKEFKRMWKRDNIGCGNNDSTKKRDYFYGLSYWIV